MISIILNSFNLSRYIGEAIQSLLEQDYQKDYEIIIVDDASTDDSRIIIESFNDPRLKKIYLQENKGARNAVELAFAKASGEYICRFDADDIWPVNFLTITSEVLDTNKDIDMVYGDYWPINSNGEITSPNSFSVRPFNNEPVLANEFLAILRKYYINAPTIMFRRAAFNKAIPLPLVLTNFIDWYISLKILQSGKAYYINRPIAFYRIHESNMHRQQIGSRLGEFTTNFIMDYFVVRNVSISNKNRNHILAINYFVLAEKYFGIKLFGDAKRLYLQAKALHWRYIFNLTFLKHLFGVFFPKYYDNIKYFYNNSLKVLSL